MSQYQHLLKKAADEVRAYRGTPAGVSHAGEEFLLSLVRRMEVASSLESEAEIELEIRAIAYMIVDSGPLTEQFAPSFGLAHDALQRRH